MGQKSKAWPTQSLLTPRESVVFCHEMVSKCLNVVFLRAYAMTDSSGKEVAECKSTIQRQQVGLACQHRSQFSPREVSNTFPEVSEKEALENSLIYFTPNVGLLKSLSTNQLSLDNGSDHRVRTIDLPFQNHAQAGLRVHRIVIQRLDG